MQIKQIKQFIIILNDKNNSSFFDINDKSTLKIADHILKKKYKQEIKTQNI